MAPEPGWTTRAYVLRVIDGDTLEIEVARKFRVRLKDCWAPELSGEHATEGAKARDALEAMIPPGSRVVVHVPTDPADVPEFAKATTFGRLVATVYDCYGRNLSEAMIEAGHATKAKSK